MKNKLLIVLLILIFSYNNIFAEDYYCKNIGISEGLSQSSITAICYDSRGALWVGTRFGLNEYRNQKVRTIFEAGPEGLDGNYINSLFIDSEEKMWVSTENGLSYYENSTDRFSQLIEGSFYCAFENDEGLLFGGNNGLALVRSGKVEFEKLDGGYIIGIHSYKGSKIIVDKGLGILIYDNGKFSNVHIPGLEGRVIMSSSIKDDLLYLSIYRGGLYIVDLSSDKIVKIFNTSNSNICYDVILSMMVIGDELLMGTDGGGLCTLNLNNYQIEPADSPCNSITVLYKDRHNNIWTGSVRSGLFGLKNSSVRTMNPGNSGLSDDVVISLCDGGNSLLWVGTDGGGVNIFNKLTGKITDIRSTYGMKISSIAELDGGRLLLSIYSRGLNILDPETGKITPFVLIDESTNSRECYYGNSPLLYNIGNGHIMICAIDIYDYDFTKEAFTRYHSKIRYNTNELKLCESYTDNIRYAYTPNMLFSIDTDSKAFNALPFDAGDRKILSSAVFDDKIWVGTDHGLYSYSLTTNKTELYQTKLFQRVTQLKFDISGSLWIAADNTLFRMRGGRIEIFGENEGFAANEVLTSAISMQKDDECLYLGGTNGLVEIKINEIASDGLPKKLILNSLSVGGKRQIPDSDRVRLPFNFSSIRIEVALSGADPFGKVMYRYEISGMTSYSIETYDSHIELPELKEGDYQISCSYLERDGIWSRPELILSIRVKPPFYRSIWFLTFVIALSVYIIVYIVRRLYRRKVRALEQKLRADNINFINKIENYIRENISDPELNVDALASYMAMSRASLYSRVKSVYGHGVSQFIDNIRMKEACRLLSETSLSIAEVSDKIGYATYRYFSTKFKKCYGLSPREYRKNNFSGS